MGFFDNIPILGDLLGTGGSKSEASQLPTMTPEQTALFNTLLGKSKTALTGGTPSYPGQMYTPQNQYETSYLNSVGGDPTQNAARDQAYLNVLGAKPAYEIDPAAREKYYQESFYNPAMREYKETILPQVLESASGAGFRSSDTLNQMGKSAADLETNLSAKRAELLWNDELSRRNALESAFGRQASLVGSPSNIMTGVPGEMASAGTYARQIANEKVAADLSRWLGGETIDGKASPYSGPEIQLAMALLGITPYTYAQQTETTNPGIITSFLSGAGQGAGQAGMTKFLAA